MGLTQTTTFAQLAAELRGGAALPGAGMAKPGGGAMPPLLGRVLGQLLRSDVRDRFATGTDPRGAKWKPLRFARPNGGDQPLRDTGRLMASISVRSDATGVEVYTVYPGAVLHNFGGTVRPTKGKYLAIPLTKEAKRSGGPRRFGRPLSVRPTGKRNVLVLEETRRGQRVGQFLLVKSVTVPQREFMGLSAKGLRLCGEALAEFAVRGWIDGRPVMGGMK